MKKYIDAEKLIAEIDSILSACTKQTHTGVYNTCHHIKGIIASLQQELPEVDLEKDFEDYLDNMEGQPKMWHPDEQIEWAKDIARHFYELGKNARKEEK